MSVFDTRRLGVVLVLVLVCTVPASATVVDPPETLAALARGSDLVVVAKAGESRVGDGPYWVDTVTRFRVQRVVAGELPNGELLVTAPGGQWGGRRWVIAGSPSFEPGEIYLLFLLGEGPSYRLGLLAGGVFHERELAGVRLWVPAAEASDLTPLPGRVWERPPALLSGVLEDHLGAVLGGEEEWSLPRVEAPIRLRSELEKNVPEGCKLMSGRRFSFDFGVELEVFRGMSPHPDYADGGTHAVVQGIELWAADPGSNLRMSYGGVGVAPNCDGVAEFWDMNPHDTVVFEDPCSVVPEDYIRGYTGVVCEGTATFDGQELPVVIGSICLINDGHDLSESLFDALVAHELGHVLGFSHFTGETCLMNNVEEDGTRLWELDRTCAAYYYPLPAHDASLGFTITPGEPRAGQQLSFEAAAANDPDSWSWAFSDGVVLAGQRVERRFAGSGDHTVTLTAGAGALQYSATRTIQVLGPSMAVVAAAANTPGAAGTDWHTDLVLLNRGVQAASGFIECRAARGVGCGGESFQIPPRQALVMSDVVAGLGDAAVGSLLTAFDGDGDVLVASRTFTRSAVGSFGQAIPGLPAEDPGHFYIPVVRHDEEFRTNIGVASASDVAQEVVLRLHVDGEVVEATMQLAPWAWQQWPYDTYFSVDLADAATVEVILEQPAVVYASVVDNRSGDPVFVPATAPSTHWQVPVVAAAPGANDTSWDSELFLFNADDETAEVSLRLLRDGGETNASIVVAGHSTQHLRGLMHEMFGVDSGSGALEVRSAARLVVETRIATTTAAGGTAGQRVPAVDVAAGEAPGRTIAWLHEDEDYRSNVGFSNIADSRAELRLRLFDPHGGVLAERRINVNPQTVVQRSLVQLFGADVAAALDGRAWLEAVDALACSPPVILYASVVDNVSGDPVLELAR